MARTAIDLQTPTRAGLTPVFTNAILDGHMVSNNGRMILRIRNTGEAEVDVTVRFGGSVDGTPISGGKVITVPDTTGDVVTAVWPVDDYNQPDGRIWIDYEATDGVSVAALSV